MRVRYTIDSLLHIAAIHSYISDRNPAAATRVVARIKDAVARIGENPRIGHVGTAPGTRELVVTGLPYVIVHEPNEAEDELVILGIYHGAQLRPGQESHEP
jgi:plasmid stabilization system protein ParE